MASWKSTCTCVDIVPPPGANIFDGMWIFRVKRPPGSPPTFKARYVARGFTQRDYELHSLDFSTTFLQGSLHEEIWLRRPPGFTGTTLAALGFAPSSADPSLSTPSVLGSSCEVEIYAGAMATQELRWLTYLLTDLGERPRSPPVLYIDNKAMLALCHEQRLEQRMKHISLHYFLARELQQRRQLRLSYVASRANTAYVFTKALGSGDHQRFCTALGLVPTLPHLLVA
ncbi:unnamed protein product [Closterium sp. NIES-53]